MSIIRITDNNPYLLIAGTDQPQRDGEGVPIANPNFGHVTETVIADPPPSINLSAVAFIKRLTLAERAAIMGSADNIVKAFLFELQAASNGGADVHLDDADTIAGTNYLESSGLIGVGRAAQILTP